MFVCIILVAVFATIAVDIRGQSIVGFTTGRSDSPCAGYCDGTVLIQPSTISTWESSTATKSAFPEIQQQYNVNSIDFTELNARVGNLSAWQALPITIGCLSCDGQGFEFLGILTDNQLKYSVMFEYNSTIPALNHLSVWPEPFVNNTSLQVVPPRVRVQIKMQLQTDE
ncbi:unnamed protein product [Rotaria socialis]|uniref:Uncharacterized protein n=1 Tax=Rotaria socialis TaxID=392032 RepID=A0A818UF69_9BILA|nr:unnamed protein product [Rotaria socialis]CAF3697544.1 unnamed protein product [Rotaria socialis]CAF4451511.1 unnamed protein product [Rotaria socialis]CAF4722058.1 unnamed protein product [Rotaria socialis]